MTSAFVIRNQLGQYLTRKGEWVSGRDASALFHQPWYDQALNHLIETNSKDIELRGKVVELELDEKGRPAVLELGPDSQQPALLDESATVARAAANESAPAESEPAAQEASADAAA
ncbi:MAG TPA: hypothetical protein VM553_11785 [Dongiaceae bacterium]|nr:hypothetical protein [Dongiaceae bacterium]